MRQDEKIVSTGLVIVIGAAVLLLIVMQPLTPKYGEKHFSSYNELTNFLKERTESQGFGGQMLDVARSLGTAEVAPMAAGTGTKATEYSATNIQVEGVDEPDIVKNDGRYIYSVSSDNVTIVDAYPAGSMKIVSEIGIDGSISDIFVNKDKLVVFGNKWGHWGGPVIAGAETGVAVGMVSRYPYYSSENSFIYVYDITDRNNPTMVRNISLEGSYHDARMIGDYVYAILQQPVRMLDSGPVLPVMAVDANVKTIDAGEISYFDAYDTSFTYNFMIALNTQNDDEKPTEKVFLLGYSQNLYVSQDGIYTVYTKYMSELERTNRVIEAMIPSFPLDLQARVRAVQGDKNTTSYEKVYEISKIVQGYAASLGPEGGAKFMKTLEEKTREVMVEIEKQTEVTVIHKIGISGPSIEYKTSGEVPGRVLNQFSMDEFNGNFRIATTTGRSWGGTSLNHMYVLNPDLQTIGRLENLAPTEQIYSVRFMGEKAYMVTFRRTDPLFVIDLSNPTAPAVLGELKIPGFSDYLHPVDKDHLIGLGQMTDEGGRTTGQVKLSLFDVSDVANPKETSSYLIGEKGDWAYSEALNDHKAFLFSQSKGLLTIPVSVNNWHGSQGKYFQGAYVFGFSLENGFNLKGKVTHQITDASSDEQYYDYQSAVRRSLYMDNTLYTISNEIIKANSLADLSEISKVRLQEPDAEITSG